MANPDGYEYSRTQNRLWRKNRRDNRNSGCDGVDLNRNWDIGFGVGASSNPCSNTYKGTTPFSEPETAALSEDMKLVNEQNDLRLMVSFHCYAQVLIYPWGYTGNPAPGTPEMKAAGEAFVEGARKNKGRKYKVANSYTEFYAASGATDDWAKGKLNVPYSYTLELPDQGQFGFVLPPNRILFTFDEVQRGIRRLIDAVFSN